jgi:hypothetical protein
MITKERYSREIEAAIAKANAAGSRENLNGSEVYAYPHRDGVAWGVNAPETGVNILRGIRRTDGGDEAEG